MAPRIGFPYSGRGCIGSVTLLFLSRTTPVPTHCRKVRSRRHAARQRCDESTYHPAAKSTTRNTARIGRLHRGDEPGVALRRLAQGPNPPDAEVQCFRSGRSDWDIRAGLCIGRTTDRTPGGSGFDCHIRSLQLAGTIRRKRLYVRRRV